MKALIIVLVLLSACGTTAPVVITPIGASDSVSPVSGAELAKVKETVNIDRSLLTECGSFTNVAVGATLDGLLSVHAADAVVMRECATQTSELVKLLKEALNIK